MTTSPVWIVAASGASRVRHLSDHAHSRAAAQCGAVARRWRALTTSQDRNLPACAHCERRAAARAVREIEWMLARRERQREVVRQARYDCYINGPAGHRGLGVEERDLPQPVRAARTDYFRALRAFAEVVEREMLS